MIAFRSFRTRLIVFLLALLLPVLAGIFYFVNSNNRNYTDQTINRYLELGAGVFDFTRQEQSHTLLAILSSLTWDFGFRTAYGAMDDATLFDAALNVLNRSMGGVDILLVVDLDGRMVIDTALQGFNSLENEWRDLIVRANDDEEGIAEAVIAVQGIPYQVIASPLYLPRQVAWVIGGFALDQEFLDTVKRNTLSDVSLLEVETDRAPEVLASTLPVSNWQGLANQIAGVFASDSAQRLELDDGSWGTLSRRLSDSSAGTKQYYAVIQRSYSENIENQRRFQRLLAEFYGVILLLSVVAVIFLARSITNPLSSLAAMVRKIEQGDYNRTVNISARDELGQLADSVNSMAIGLAEKEKVRDLLGKVVSKQIAEELIRNPVELGGEEKVITILFADLKGFTSYCEGRPPQEVLAVLNTYLSKITNIIEANNGVVDKFNGDAVMALFGAPISHSNDAENALRSALQIRSSITAMRQEAQLQSNAEQLDVCIGIHTGNVVAGNLGSINRLNYSVIGDSVNLASRLENLTRYYRVANIVSEASVSAAPGFVYCELDQVRVVGKNEPVRIFQVLGEEGQVSDLQLQEIRQFEEFLLLYRRRQWEKAERQLTSLSSSTICSGLAGIYQDRITAFKINPPADNWCGVFTFDKK